MPKILMNEICGNSFQTHSISKSVTLLEELELEELQLDSVKFVFVPMLVFASLDGLLILQKMLF